MKIGITAPVFIKNNEHLDWLNKTTKSIVSKEHDVVFIPVENYVAPEYTPLAYRFDHEPLAVCITHGMQPQSVARAWNTGIEQADILGCEYVLVINTDIVLKSNLIDRLVAFAQAQSEAVIWSASEFADLARIEEAEEDENYSEHPNFSCFMVRTDFLEECGEFDTNFIPAYCEDGDMHARIALANKKAYTYGGAKFYHKRSNTISTDRELWNKNSQTFPKNQKYFLEKWGHPIVGDVDEMRKLYYQHPYNESDKPLSFYK